MKYYLLHYVLLYLLLYMPFVYYGNKDLVNSTKNKSENHQATINENPIFTEDIILNDIEGNPINLKHLKITKDTVVLIIWCKRCIPCLKKMDTFKQNNLHQRYRIISIATIENNSNVQEKEFIAKHKWTFEFYFDSNQTTIKYLIKKGYLKKPYYMVRDDVIVYTNPSIYMFAGNKFLCFNCENFINM